MTDDLCTGGQATSGTTETGLNSATRRRNALISVSVLCSVVLVYMSLAGCPGRSSATRDPVADTMARGDAIIAALESYKNDNRMFPNTLTDLVPHYMKEIDVPIIGNGAWIYRQLDEGSSFSLRSDGDSDFTSVTKAAGWSQWLVDTK